MWISQIHSRAPTRIDLSGGTVDLWPLFLFVQNPVTLNVAINLYAEANVDIQPTQAGHKTSLGQVTLRSEDQDTEVIFPWPRILIGDIPIPPQLDLHFKLLRFFTMEKIQKSGTAFPFSYNLKITTRAKSPAGAGLGGSSALNIATLGALATWARGRPVNVPEEGERLIEIARDVETTVIKVPAGLQDYYGAMFGGLQSLKWGIGSHQRDPLPEELLPELDKRILLFYSGLSRNSGINNWVLFKGLIDQNAGVQDKFQKITNAAHSLETALLCQDWKKASQAIAGEWQSRRMLATGISTGPMNRAFELARQVSPDLSGKVCGAGGGGCFFFFLPSGDPELKARLLEQRIPGIHPLPFKTAPKGLEIQVNRA